MPIIKSKVDFEPEIAEILVKCPACNQKMAGIEMVKGIIILKFKCRRCKQYFTVRVIE